MKKITKKLTLDITVIIIFIINLISGFIIMFGILTSRFQLNQDSTSNQLLLLNFTANNPAMILHIISGILFLSLTVYHLILNWKTFTGYFKVLLRKKIF
jgi:hypothetical protein